MSAKLFEIMKLLEDRHITFTILRLGPLDLVIMAFLVGKRVEISIDENDMVDVCVFSGSENVVLGMDAVLAAIREDD